MASINKLSIRGVRAFSPDDQEQVIEFYFPVTVIVGANGCGKTTIIESLKYAVTGSLPPGNKSGQAFVHDPKSIGQSSVKANIKLRFTNRAGQQMVVVRSMEVTQKKTTMSFKALDGILRTTNPQTGEKVSMSHKCTELDRQIPLLLGVSKPILDNVVFCHQEDSSWPLMEGAVLKKRFDDIFDSTRYAKALKAIQETKKEYNSIVKDLKGDLQGLASHKHAAKGFRQELSQQSEELEDLEENVQALTDDIRKVEDEIKRNEAIAEEVEEQNLIIEEKQVELTRKTSVLDAHRKMLKDDLTNTRSARELKEMLRDFDKQMSEQIEKRQDLKQDYRAAETAIRNIGQEDRNLREQIGKLDAQKVAHDERLARRLEKMDGLCSEYNIELPTTQTQNMSFTQQSVADSVTTFAGGASQDTMVVAISAEDMHSFFKSVDDKEADLKQTLNEYRIDSERQADGYQEALNEISAQVAGVESELKKLEDEQSAGRDEIQNLNTQSGTQHSRLRKSDLDESKKRMEEFIEKRNKANADQDLKDIPIQIRSKEGEIDVLKREIEYDNQALKELRQNTEAQNSIVVLKEQAKIEIENLQESMTFHSYDFNKYNLTPPAVPALEADSDGEQFVGAMGTFSATVQEKYETAQQELGKAKDDLVTKQRLVSEKSALLSHSKQTLASLRNKIDALGGDNGSVGKFQRTVTSIRQYEVVAGAGTTPVLQGSDPQEVMKHLSSRLEDINASASESINPEVLGKVIDKIYEMSAVKDGGSDTVQCPCCTRDFEGMDDFRKFKESLDRMKDIETSELLRANRQEVEKSRAVKEDYERWRKVVSETMHDVIDWNRMSTEAKDTEVTISDIEAELATFENDVSTLQGSITELQSEEKDLRAIADAVKRITEDAGRLSRKKMEIDQKKSDLSMYSDNYADRDLQEVEKSLSDKQAQKDSLNNMINELNRKMTTLNGKITTLSTKATDFEKMYRDRQERYNREQKSNVRKGELQERLAEIGDQVPKLKSQVQSLKRKETAKKSDRDKFRNSMHDELEAQGDKLRKFESEVSALRQLQKEIDAYLDSSKEEDLARINEKIATLQRRLESKNAELERIKPSLNNIAKAIGDQEAHKKLIEDNLKLIGYKEDIAKLEEDIAQMDADVKKVKGYDMFAKALEECQKQLSELSQRRSHHEGRRGAFLEQIRTLKRKLKTPEYKDIDERHRIVVIKHETTQIAVGDLDKYHTALDNALLRYHGIKIEEINRIIRELWNLTYKGEDITTIELVSGQEKNAKKSYNYRVVMSKGGTKLDMRGRCSAGQRVLASIVIRLALAETFCVNCGCIALDEPTVNLDYSNKRGLAIALAQIIASRAQQSNFQLIVITHDEEFVTMMKTELASQSGFSMPEKYFQVRREEGADNKHYSKIDAIDWDELV